MGKTQQQRPDAIAANGWGGKDVTGPKGTARWVIEDKDEALGYLSRTIHVFGPGSAMVNVWSVRNIDHGPAFDKVWILALDEVFGGAGARLARSVRVEDTR